MSNPVMDPRDQMHVVVGGGQVAEMVDGANSSGFQVSFDLGMNERTGKVEQTWRRPLTGAWGARRRAL